jgi:Flp pilus assembly protein TadG
MLGDLTGRLCRNRDGNVAMIFALSIIPIIFFAGLGLDFAAATQKRVKLNAAADAAALAAVAPGMMNQPDASSPLKPPPCRNSTSTYRSLSLPSLTPASLGT